jgi:hypothetical protein
VKAMVEPFSHVHQEYPGAKSEAYANQQTP